MEQKDQTNVFVKYLPSHIDNATLLSLFSPYGRVLSAKVMVDQFYGLSLGYGFVKYSKPEEAVKAIEGMAGYKIGSKALLCKFSDSFSFPDPSCNLYIKPLPLGMSDDELSKIFGKYGTIHTVKLLGNVGMPDSMIGFVKYEKIESATKAVEELNGVKLFSHLPVLIVKYAESENRRAVRKAKNQPPRKTFISVPSLSLPLSLSSLPSSPSSSSSSSPRSPHSSFSCSPSSSRSFSPFPISPRSLSSSSSSSSLSSFYSSPSFSSDSDPINVSPPSSPELCYNNYEDNYNNTFNSYNSDYQSFNYQNQSVSSFPNCSCQNCANYYYPGIVFVPIMQPFYPTA